jgi:hypothetical protein
MVAEFHGEIIDLQKRDIDIKKILKPVFGILGWHQIGEWKDGTISVGWTIFDHSNALYHLANKGLYIRSVGLFYDNGLGKWKEAEAKEIEWAGPPPQTGDCTII